MTMNIKHVALGAAVTLAALVVGTEVYHAVFPDKGYEDHPMDTEVSPGNAVPAGSGGVLSYPAPNGDLTAGGWVKKGTATGGDLYGKPEYIGPAKDVSGTFYPYSTDRWVTLNWLGMSAVVNLTKLFLAFGMLVVGLIIGRWSGRKSALSTFDNERW